MSEKRYYAKIYHDDAGTVTILYDDGQWFTCDASMQALISDEHVSVSWDRLREIVAERDDAGRAALGEVRE